MPFDLESCYQALVACKLLSVRLPFEVVRMPLHPRFGNPADVLSALLVADLHPPSATATMLNILTGTLPQACGPDLRNDKRVLLGLQLVDHRQLVFLDAL